MKIIYVCLDTKSRSISWSKSRFWKRRFSRKARNVLLSKSRPPGWRKALEIREGRHPFRFRIVRDWNLPFHGMRVQNEANEHTKSFGNIKVLKKVSYRLNFSSFLFFSVRTLRESTFVFAKSRKKKEKKEIVASKRLTFEIQVNVSSAKRAEKQVFKNSNRKTIFPPFLGRGDRKLFVLTEFKVEPATDQAGKILFGSSKRSIFWKIKSKI